MSAPIYHIGRNVPWNVAWSREWSARWLQKSSDPVARFEVSAPDCPGAGTPRFKDQHPDRSRRAVEGDLCPICGKPTAAGDRWLFLDGGTVPTPQGVLFVFSEPPTHGACAALASKACPHLRARRRAPVQYDGAFVLWRGIGDGRSFKLEGVAKAKTPDNAIVLVSLLCALPIAVVEGLWPGGVAEIESLGGPPYPSNAGEL